MAYKQSPGRGNNAKTGHGIPAPFKQVDKEVDAMIARKKARNENEMKATSDSTATDNKLKGAGFGKITSGEMGNKKANETRSTLQGHGFTISMDKDKTTEKYKKNYNTSPAKQVDKEVESMIAKKKERDAKAKNDKARSEGEAARSKVESGIRIKLKNENENKAKSDSTAVDKKLRDVGMPYNAGVMGNKKANETRKAGSPYAKSYESVDEDKTTGKYKRNTNFKDSPAKMKKSPMKQGLNFSTKEDMAKSGAKPYKGSDRQKANEKANEARKASPAKQLGRQAVTKVSAKKAPAKMKKC